MHTDEPRGSAVTSAQKIRLVDGGSGIALRDAKGIRHASVVIAPDDIVKVEGAIEGQASTG